MSQSRKWQCLRRHNMTAPSTSGLDWYRKFLFFTRFIQSVRYFGWERAILDDFDDTESRVSYISTAMNSATYTSTIFYPCHENVSRHYGQFRIVVWLVFTLASLLNLSLNKRNDKRAQSRFSFSMSYQPIFNSNFPILVFLQFLCW